MIGSQLTLCAEFPSGGGLSSPAINTSFVKLIMLSFCCACQWGANKANNIFKAVVPAVLLLFIVVWSGWREQLTVQRSPHWLLLSLFCSLYRIFPVCGDTVQYCSWHCRDSFSVVYIHSLSNALRGLTWGIFTVMGRLPLINNNHRWLGSYSFKQKKSIWHTVVCLNKSCFYWFPDKN